MKNITGIKKAMEIELKEWQQHIDEEVTFHGSISKIRRMKGFGFLVLRTRNDCVQCVYEEKDNSIPLSELKEEMCVEISGKLRAEERAKTGCELHVTTLSILSKPAEALPVVISNKELELGINTLLDYRPLTLRNEKQRAIFKLQEGICRGMRSFFYQEQFTEIHTPKIVAAGAEGGSNIFRLAYFEQEAFLAQSPQFYKEMMVGVYERVFEIAPVYRAEKHDTKRHLNEYTSVDMEMGFIHGFEEIMELETRLLQSTMQFLKQEYIKELDLLKVEIPKVNAIPAITFREAKEKISKNYERKINDREDFEPEEEKLLSEAIKEETGSDFVFVTHYPTKKRPFYAMEDEENKEVTKSFDLLFRGVEITTGGQRIHDYETLLDKMKKRKMDTSTFESYFMIHRYGILPHGGFGLGLERFTCQLLTLDNIRYATLFPRDKNRLIP